MRHNLHIKTAHPPVPKVSFNIKANQNPQIFINKIFAYLFKTGEIKVTNQKMKFFCCGKDVVNYCRQEGLLICDKKYYSHSSGLKNNASKKELIFSETGGYMTTSVKADETSYPSALLISDRDPGMFFRWKYPTVKTSYAPGKFVRKSLESNEGKIIMKSICINCGSNIGLGDNYKAEAIKLGRYLARKNISIVYGGADVGLMGIIADTALSEGGEVIGIIPKSIEDKVGHKYLTKLYVVETMHERKNMMFKLSDGFIAFPGGFGTLEEIFELLTWSQLGFHNKPCGFLNIEGYYNKLFDFIDHAVEQRFIKKEHSEMLIKRNNIEDIIKQFKNYKAPIIGKWIK